VRLKSEEVQIPVMKRHVVLTSGRSGSNHLVAALNHHEELCNFGEVLGAWTLSAKLWSPLAVLGASKSALLDVVYDSRAVYYAAQSISYLRRRARDEPTHFRSRGALKSIGVKEFFLHLRDEGTLSWFVACQDLSIVHLRREDMLARALSVLRLRESGRAVRRVGERQGAALHVDPIELLKLLGELEVEEREEEEIIKRLSHHRCLSLVYERDLADAETTDATLARTCEFLGVHALKAPETGHRSAVSGKAISAVENRAEVERALIDSSYATLLVRHQSS
jgi:hypothetical protein